jgi:Protein of unknown function (DUF1059)
MPADLDQREGGSHMARTVFDCARVPGKTCTLQIIGDKKDVLPAAKQHLVSAHAMKASPQLEENISKVVDDHAKRYSTWV